MAGKKGRSGVYKRTEKHLQQLARVRGFITEESNKKISKARLKRKKKLGYINSPEARKKMSKARMGHFTSKETKKKLSEALRGEKSYLWRGGISFNPYSVDWTRDLKRAIRKRDRYICQICGKEPATDVHHIDYNKKDCNPDNLITLCRKCHLKTNQNRKFWQNYLKKKENE